ncbi:hypothetical protein M2347_000939 [Chryseobacterium sp. H1D6B]|uniref:hypothetical protein n=1 Tax=Chryseobacterium sp. H1D6B TaxID=2940588 RepID=UPI0015CA9896|nr:hypothetical protein [Chryseobacterium sp. H1D6B]MDH6251212.1 hypothetical protein [Chryseobacterium sp. H1D6B]
MKNIFKISSLALLTLATYSCSTDNDMTSEEPVTLNSKNMNSQQKIGVIKTEVLAESNKISSLNMGGSLVLNYGNVNLHLDLQQDSNLVLYASPIYWVGPPPNPVKWATNTIYPVGANIPFLSAQTDGNLVLYKSAPYNAGNSIWATNTAAGNVADAKFKLQLLKKINALNSGSPKYYVAFILEGFGVDRQEITINEITDIY